MRHMIDKCGTSSMKKYNCTAARYRVDAPELLCIARHKTSRKQPSVAHQYTALLTLPDHNMPPMKADDAYQGYLPCCELHSHDSRPLTVRRYSMKVRRYRLHTQITRSWDCASLLCNLEIGCAISGFWECATLEIAQILRLRRTHIVYRGGRHCCLLIVDMRWFYVGASPHMIC